jgi:hypothetical protein
MGSGLGKKRMRPRLSDASDRIFNVLERTGFSGSPQTSAIAARAKAFYLERPDLNLVAQQ